MPCSRYLGVPPGPQFRAQCTHLPAAANTGCRWLTAVSLCSSELPSQGYIVRVRGGCQPATDKRGCKGTESLPWTGTTLKGLPSSRAPCGNGEVSVTTTLQVSFSVRPVLLFSRLYKCVSQECTPVNLPQAAF